MVYTKQFTDALIYYATLEYYDGPLTMLYFDKYSERSYLYNWCDIINSRDIWSINYVSDKTISDYINNRISFYDLLTVNAEESFGLMQDENKMNANVTLLYMLSHRYIADSQKDVYFDGWD